MVSSKKTTASAGIITINSYVDASMKVLDRLMSINNFNPTGRYIKLSLELGRISLNGKPRAIKLAEVLTQANQVFGFLANVWVSLESRERSRVRAYNALTVDTARSIQSRANYHYTKYVLCSEVDKSGLDFVEMKKAFRMAVLTKGLKFLPSFKDFLKAMSDVAQDLDKTDEFIRMEELLVPQYTPTGIRLVGFVKGPDEAEDIDEKLVLLMAEFEKRFLKRFDVIDVDKEVKLALKAVGKAS